MNLGKYQVTASRWPWQGYGWFPHRLPAASRKRLRSYAPLNSSGARFGGGWKWRLGVSVGSSSTMIDLLFGTITIRKVRK